MPDARVLSLTCNNESDGVKGGLTTWLMRLNCSRIFSTVSVKAGRLPREFSSLNFVGIFESKCIGAKSTDFKPLRTIAVVGHVLPCMLSTQGF